MNQYQFAKLYILLKTEIKKDIFYIICFWALHLLIPQGDFIFLSVAFILSGGGVFNAYLLFKMMQALHSIDTNKDNQIKKAHIYS